MDVLETYKKSWKNQPEDTQKVSKVAIYKMTHKKSSSIVKWIFIIGIVEFIIVTTSILFLQLHPELKNMVNQFKNIFWLSEVISYIIIFYFLFKFYKNYKSISTSDDTKTLMNKIIKTRKTVKNYFIVNLVFGILFSLFPLFSMQQTMPNKNSYIIIIVSILTATLLIFVFYWLYYQLVYGILLRKLNKNYKELAKLDELQ